MTTPTIAIILAGGIGTRMEGFSIPKQFLPLGKGSVISRSIHTFCSLPLISEILVVIPQEDSDSYNSHFESHSFSKPLHIISGGQTRQESSYNAIKWITSHRPNTDLVAIHDAARPFVSTQIIQIALNAAKVSGASEPALPVQDTIIQVSHGQLQETLKREKLYAVQTPQCFQLALISKAHQKALNYGYQNITDDATLIHHIGHAVKIVLGHVNNFKITYSQDYERAQKEIDKIL
jgi:2-C-methyl-D-erythritol 4-phosphate cytidylyltransferase